METGKQRLLYGLPCRYMRFPPGQAAFVMSLIDRRHSYRFGYLKSDHWADLRLRKLVEQDAQCQVCRKRDLSNDVHHVIYPKSLYDTQLDDLVVLCREHHEAVHSVLDSNADIKDRDTARSRWTLTFRRLRDFRAIAVRPEDKKERKAFQKWMVLAGIPKGCKPKRPKHDYWKRVGKLMKRRVRFVIPPEPKYYTAKLPDTFSPTKAAISQKRLERQAENMDRLSKTTGCQVTTLKQMNYLQKHRRLNAEAGCAWIIPQLIVATQFLQYMTFKEFVPPRELALQD